MRYLLLIFCFFSFITHAKDIPLSQLTLPQDYRIDIFADNVEGARQMALGSKTLFIGTNQDKVYAVSLTNDKKIRTLISKLNFPTGVAFINGDLYIAEVDKISRIRDIENHLDQIPKPQVIAHLPENPEHGFRYIKIGPDKKLYVAIGMNCNACIKKDSRMGTIMNMDLDGSHQMIYTDGLRNSVGFDWDPITHYLWMSDNGRDFLGDNQPPDKLNVATKAGMNFGFPFYNGKNLLDPDVGKKKPASFTYTPPTYNLPAHVAPLGITFYKGNQILIAEHGSWNRSKKVGYQVVMATIDKDKVISLKSFITGWLKDDKFWGRPVDMVVMNDGTLLISDDFIGVIYQIKNVIQTS